MSSGFNLGSEAGRSLLPLPGGGVPEVMMMIGLYEDDEYKCII